MAKQGEIDYLSKFGPEVAAHARGKPFSDSGCGALLFDMGGVFIVLPPPPARILDLGCGSGWTSVMLARRGYDVVGQDISPGMIALAEENRAASGLPNLRFVVADYESAGGEGEFDAVLFYDSLHHSVDPPASMAMAWRALKAGGVLVTVEPGAGHAASEAARNAVATLDVTERDMPPSLVARLGAEAGFRESRVYPMPKTLASLQYQARPPRWWPAAWAPFYRWLVIGWVSLPGRMRYGGLVVLTK